MISFIVPCYNEGNLVSDTVVEIEKATKKLLLRDYEILIIFDNGNNDTKKIAINLKKKNKKIKVYINKKNLGYGGSVKKGIKESSRKFVMWIPGDRSHLNSEIYKIISKYKNRFDAITTYYSNTECRSKFRDFFTKFYTPLLNMLFAMNMKYYNGITLIKSDIIKSITICTDSHNFSFEMWVKLNLKEKKIKIKNITTMLNDRVDGATAFKIKNSIRVVYNVIRLFFYFWFYKFIYTLR